MNSYPDVIEAATQYSDYVHTILPEVKVYLFGSYAKGCPTKKSDIDIGIISDDISYLGQSRYIEVWENLLCSAYDFDARIEPHLVSKKHDRADFSGVIEHTGIQLV